MDRYNNNRKTNITRIVMCPQMCLIQNKNNTNLMKVHVHGYGIGQVWLHLAYKHVQFGLVVVIEVLQQLDNQFSNTFCFFYSNIHYST